MSIALVTDQLASAQGVYTTSLNVSLPGNVTSGNLVVFGVSSKNYTLNDWTTGDVSFSGTATRGTLTLEATTSNSGTGRYAAVYSVPITGTGSLTITLAAPADTVIRVFVAEFSGVDTGASRAEDTDTVVDNTGSNAVSSPSMTSAGEALWFVAMDRVNAATWTVSSPAVQIGSYSPPGEAGGAGAYAIYTTGGSRAISWSSPAAGDYFVGAGAVYKVAAAGGGRTTRNPRSHPLGLASGVSFGIGGRA